MTEEELFHQALGLRAEDRAAFLDRACAGDSRLRAAVEALLRGHDATRGPLDLPPTSFAANDAQPGAVIGPYKLVEQIGEGGMGAVWMAQQHEPVKRVVALKLIKAGMDSRQVVARFEAERQALALMDHPNIARVLDAGTTVAGRPYFVMDLVKGVPITRYCDEHRLSPRQRLELFISVCHAVQHAHQKGIIHRDLKPSNVLVASYDGRPVPKVIDFGVAKATGQQLTDKTLITGFGAVVGTLEYMSPEQAEINQLDVDTRSDVYSLGVILYELLAGSPPFSRKDLEKAGMLEMLRVIREQEPSKPSTKLSTAEALPTLAANRATEPASLTKLVRGELDWIVMKSLEKDRSRRYETANGFAMDVQRYLAGEPVLAVPAGPWYRLRKFARRNRGPVLAAGLVLLALVAGVIGTTAGLFEAQRQTAFARHAAEEERQAKVREAERAEAEQKAKLEAQRNLAFARKGNEILGAVFEGLDPKQIAESGRPLQDVLRENLGKAVRELEGSAIGDPLEVADMQHTLGRSLLGLGEYALAVEVLGNAMRTQQVIRGPDHPHTVSTMINLGVGHLKAGRPDKALPLFEETTKRRQAALGKDDPNTLHSINYLARAYQDVGQLGKALTLFEETLKLTKAELGPDHPRTLICMNSLAGGYLASGQTHKALLLWDEALALMKAKRGVDHPDTLSAMNNLAAGYVAAKQPDKALSLLEEAVDLSRAKLGSDHPGTLVLMKNLSDGYLGVGRVDDAIALLDETVTLMKAKFGSDHPNTLAAMGSLAQGYSNARQIEKARTLLEETLKLSKAKFGSDHPHTLNNMNDLARIYFDNEQVEKALPLYEEVVKRSKPTLGPEHPLTLLSMNCLAAAYYRLKRLDQSIPLFETTLRIQEKNLGRRHSNTLRTVGNLGINYRAASRFQEAIPLLEEAYQASKKHPDLRFVCGSLIESYTATGETFKRTSLLEQQLPGIRKELPTESPKLAELLVLFGGGLLDQKRWSEAERPLREGLAIRTKIQPDAWTTFNTQSILGGALLGQKKYADAEPLLLKGYEGMKQREKTIPPAGAARLHDAIDRLIELYTATNRPDDVKKWKAERAKHPSPKK